MCVFTACGGVLEHCVVLLHKSVQKVLTHAPQRVHAPADGTKRVFMTRSCLNIIQTALKFYYVVPSAERYREIVLMQNLCPGQRLNYAFDYMHFDTGIHTQQRVYAQRHHEYIHRWIPIQESDT